MSKHHRPNHKAPATRAAAPPAPLPEPGADRKAPPAPNEEARTREVPKAFGTRRYIFLLPLVVCTVAAALLFGIPARWNAWVGAQASQKTDDAQLRADITPLSTKVSGTVARVAVQDYQHVRKGDLLVELKSTDFRAQVGQAAAGVEGAKASIDNNRKQKDLQDSRIDLARTAVDAARADISRGQAAIEAARADEQNAASAVDAAEAGVSAAQANIEESTAEIESARGNVAQAQASLETAQANIAAAEASQKAADSGVETARQSVQAVQATIRGAQADVVRAGKERSRQRYLLARGYTARAVVEQATAADEGAQSTLSAEQAQLRQAQAALASQQAQLEQATAAVGASRAAHRQAQAALTSRQAALQQAEAVHTTRQAALRTAEAQFEGSKSAAARARSQISLQQAALEQARAQLAGRGADLTSQQRQQRVLDAQGQGLVADLHSKQEARKLAQTSLEYTRIFAPADGMVGERKVRAGQLVSPGTQVLSLVQGTLWIQANYKETQLTHVRPGDPAEATVDAFPGLVLRGHVQEIAPASGAQFALLPPDNATGNFTKITQRIPVKIALDIRPEIAARLRAGMSVTAAIKPSGRRMAWGSM